MESPDSTPSSFSTTCRTSFARHLSTTDKNRVSRVSPNTKSSFAILSAQIASQFTPSATCRGDGSPPIEIKILINLPAHPSYSKARAARLGRLLNRHCMPLERISNWLTIHLFMLADMRCPNGSLRVLVTSHKFFIRLFAFDYLQ